MDMPWQSFSHKTVGAIAAYNKRQARSQNTKQEGDDMCDKQQRTENIQLLTAIFYLGSEGVLHLERWSMVNDQRRQTKK